MKASHVKTLFLYILYIYLFLSATSFLEYFKTSRSIRNYLVCRNESTILTERTTQRVRNYFSVSCFSGCHTSTSKVFRKDKIL